MLTLKLHRKKKCVQLKKKLKVFAVKEISVNGNAYLLDGNNIPSQQANFQLLKISSDVKTFIGFQINEIILW